MEKTAIYKNGEELVELRENTHEALAEALEWAKEAIQSEEDDRTYYQICMVIAENEDDARDYYAADIDFIAYEVYKDRVLQNENGQMVLA